jgi:tRNA 2-thiouridine synthesizing protein A
MDGSAYEISVSLDLTGLKCPLPVLKARRQIGQMESGILEVRADDPAAPLDFEHFCDTAGLTLLKSDAVDGLYTFHIEVSHTEAGHIEGGG